MDIFHYIGVFFSSAIACALALFLMLFSGLNIPHFERKEKYTLIYFIIGEAVIISDETMAENMIRIGYRLRVFKQKHIGIKILRWQV